jgi:hypothetical protein
MGKMVLGGCLLLTAVVAQAQNQVATVTSSLPFSLRGATVTPGQGVPMWPILAGDNVKAGNAVTIVTFPDASVLTLSAGSEAKVDFVNGKPVFQLLSGSARYSLKSLPAVQLMEATQTVTPKSLTGILTVGGNKSVGGFWTTGHTVAVVAGASAAAAGAGFGIAEATGGGAAVSPRR